MGHVVNPYLFRLNYVLFWSTSLVVKKKYSMYFEVNSVYLLKYLQNYFKKNDFINLFKLYNSNIKLVYLNNILKIFLIFNQSAKFRKFLKKKLKKKIKINYKNFIKKNVIKNFYIKNKFNVKKFRIDEKLKGNNELLNKAKNKVNKKYDKTFSKNFFLKKKNLKRSNFINRSLKSNLLNISEIKFKSFYYKKKNRKKKIDGNEHNLKLKSVTIENTKYKQDDYVPKYYTYGPKKFLRFFNYYYQTSSNYFYFKNNLLKSKIKKKFIENNKIKKFKSTANKIKNIKKNSFLKRNLEKKKEIKWVKNRLILNKKKVRLFNVKKRKILYKKINLKNDKYFKRKFKKLKKKLIKNMKIRRIERENKFIKNFSYLYGYWFKFLSRMGRKRRKKAIGKLLKQSINSQFDKKRVKYFVYNKYNKQRKYGIFSGPEYEEEKILKIPSVEKHIFDCKIFLLNYDFVKNYVSGKRRENTGKEPNVKTIFNKLYLRKVKKFNNVFNKLYNTKNKYLSKPFEIFNKPFIFKKKFIYNAKKSLNKEFKEFNKIMNNSEIKNFESRRGILRKLNAHLFKQKTKNFRLKNYFFPTRWTSINTKKYVKIKSFLKKSKIKKKNFFFKQFKKYNKVKRSAINNNKIFSRKWQKEKNLNWEKKWRTYTSYRLFKQTDVKLRNFKRRYKSLVKIKKSYSIPVRKINFYRERFGFFNSIVRYDYSKTRFKNNYKSSFLKKKVSLKKSKNLNFFFKLKINKLNKKSSVKDLNINKRLFRKKNILKIKFNLNKIKKKSYDKNVESECIANKFIKNANIYYKSVFNNKLNDILKKTRKIIEKNNKYSFKREYDFYVNRYNEKRENNKFNKRSIKKSRKYLFNVIKFKNNNELLLNKIANKKKKKIDKKLIDSNNKIISKDNSVIKVELKDDDKSKVKIIKKKNIKKKKFINGIKYKLFLKKKLKELKEKFKKIKKIIYTKKFGFLNHVEFTKLLFEKEKRIIFRKFKSIDLKKFEEIFSYNKINFEDFLKYYVESKSNIMSAEKNVFKKKIFKLLFYDFFFKNWKFNKNLYTNLMTILDKRKTFEEDEDSDEFSDFNKNKNKNKSEVVLRRERKYKNTRKKEEDVFINSDFEFKKRNKYKFNIKLKYLRRKFKNVKKCNHKKKSYKLNYRVKKYWIMFKYYKKNFKNRLYNFKNKKFFKFHNSKLFRNYSYVKNFTNKFFSFFYYTKLLKLKSKFFLALNVLFAHKINLNLLIIVKKRWGDYKTADLMADVFILRLKQKHRIKAIMRSFMNYLKNEMRGKRIYGYAILIMGRFSRKDRAVYSWYKRGAFTRSNRLIYIDYSNKRVALKFSTCSIKINIIRSLGYKEKKNEIF